MSGEGLWELQPPRRDVYPLELIETAIERIEEVNPVVNALPTPVLRSSIARGQNRRRTAPQRPAG